MMMVRSVEINKTGKVQTIQFPPFSLKLSILNAPRYPEYSDKHVNNINYNSEFTMYKATFQYSEDFFTLTNIYLNALQVLYSSFYCRICIHYANHTYF
jgi:hypothetical protein